MITGRSYRIRQKAILLLIILIVPGILATNVSADTHTWNGSVDNDWNIPDNWSPIGVPADNDDVIISSGTPIYSGSPVYASGMNSIQISVGTLTVSSGTLDTGTLTIPSGTINYSTGASIGTLILSGGILTGTGTVTVTTSFTWSDGDMTGTGVTTLASGCISSFNFKSGGAKNLNTRTLNNSGSVVFNDIVYLRNACVVNNLADGTFDVTIDGTFLNDAFGDGGTSFNNVGLLQRTAGTGIATIDAIFDNTGTIDIQSGTLRCIQNSTNSGDTIIAAGATFLFNTTGRTHSFDTGATITGSGSMNFNVGTVNFNAGFDLSTISVSIAGGTVNFNDTTTLGNLTLNDGILTGTGTVTVTTSFTWSDGDMTGTGVTTLASGCISSFNFKSGGAKNLNTRTLNNSGSVVFNDIVYLRNACVVNNLADGTFDVTIDGTFLNDAFGDGGTSFNNVGLLQRTAGTGTATIDAIFDNTGTIDIQSGTLRCIQNSTNSGDTIIAAGATFLFNTTGRTHSFDTGATITGSGSMNFNVGTVNFNAGFDLSTISVSIAGGTVNFNDTTTLGNLTLNDGILTGTGTVTVTTSFTWSDGDMTGTGVTTLASGCTTNINAGTARNLNVRTLNNSGSVVFNAIFNLKNACVVNNLADGTFDVRIDGTFLNHNSGTTSTFNNVGLLQRTAGTGIATIDAIFDNTGTIDIQSGMLRFNRSSTNSGNIQGTGTLDVSTVSFTNPGSISPGTSPGILSITGNLPQVSSSVLNIEIGGLISDPAEYDQLNVSGIATLAGTLNVNLIDGFIPLAGDSFIIMNYGSRSGIFDTVNLPSVSGLAFEVTYNDTDNFISLDVIDVDDIDSDGMNDTWETTHFGDLSHDGTADTDIDGLTDLEEYQNTTDPNDEDSDGDGYYDGEEIAKGTDPNNIEDIPSYTPGNYYVDASNTTLGDGTDTNPWKLLHHAVNIINDGTDGSYTLNVASGIYSVTNGEPDEALIITQGNVTVQGVGSAIIDGDTDLNSNWTTGIDINASDIILMDLEIRNFNYEADPGIFIITGSNIIIQTCKVHDNYGGIFVSSGAGAGIIISGCEIYNNGEGIIVVSGTSPDIKQNKIYDNGYGISIYTSSADASPNIFNNLIYYTTSGTHGIYILALGNNASPLIYHNTIDGMQYGIYMTESEGTITPEIKYNIIGTNPIDGVGISFSGGTPSVTIDYNDVWNNSPGNDYSGVSPGTGNISADPLFTGGTDFHLQTTSPCVNRIPGSAGDSITEDLEGNSRPIGAGFDMGAYENVNAVIAGTPHFDTDGEEYFNWAVDLGDAYLDFTSLTKPSSLDTQFSASHGVEFHSIADPDGSAIWRHVAVLQPESGYDYIIGNPSWGGDTGEDGRVDYEISFNTPQKRAGVERYWDITGTITQFYNQNGQLLYEFEDYGTGWGDYFFGYEVGSSNSADWIKRIVCTGKPPDNKQVGRTINVIFGSTFLSTDTTPPEPPTALNWINESIFGGVDDIAFNTSIFSDLDGYHLQTHWQVRRADNDESIFDEILEEGLTQHTISGGLLTPGLKYVWRVRYKDSSGNFSPWSEEYTFKVGTSETESMPQIYAGTGIADFGLISFVHWPDDPAATSVFDITYDPKYYRIGTYDPIIGKYIEYGNGLKIEPGRAYWVLAREGLTVNYSGIPVSLLVDIGVSLSYNDSTGNGWNMIACPNDANYLWNDVEVVEYDADGNVVFGPTAISALPDPNDYIDKRLWRWDNGSYHSDTSLMEKYKGYWVKAKQANVYLRFPADFQQASLSNSKMMFTSSVEKANRWIQKWILAPSTAIADADDSPPMPMGAFSSDTKEGGNCFIATAAYGSAMAPHVNVLREFRDHFLITNSIGKSFVELYYKTSPIMVSFISKHANLKTVVRISLLPVVGVSWLALNIGPVSTMVLMLFFAFGLIGLVRGRKKSKN